MKCRIEQIGREYFVDILVAKGCWKNHTVRASYDEAFKDIETLRAEHGCKFQCQPSQGKAA